MLIGLVGRGIGSSRSPIMHEREGARLGLDYVYRLVDFDQLGLDDAALGAVIAAAEELGFSATAHSLVFDPPQPVNVSSRARPQCTNWLV